MKYAILSDIHGNLEAFQSVLNEIEKESPDKIFFLGDIVGYGANPNQSIELLKTITDMVVVGNHDHAAVGLTDISYFNIYAKEAILWTQTHLTSDNVEYLKGLPFSRKIEDITLFHSSPKEPEKWYYIFGIDNIEDNFNYFDTRICLIGHTHVPLIIIEDKKKELFVSIENPIKIKNNLRYMINIGSVGQPRDGDNRSAYAIYDTEKNLFQIHRVFYDIHKAQAKIISEGIPEYLAYRLAYGK